MARYTFRCEECGNEVEVQCSIVDGPPVEVCKTCGEAMQRVYQIEAHIPRLTMNAWDTLYKTEIEPEFDEYRRDERKKELKKWSKGKRRTHVEGVIR